MVLNLDNSMIFYKNGSEIVLWSNIYYIKKIKKCRQTILNEKYEIVLHTPPSNARCRADCSEHTTVTSRAVSRPPVHPGMKTSPGCMLPPGSIPLSSFVGPKASLTAVWYRVSRSLSCLTILSPPVPQQRA